MMNTSAKDPEMNDVLDTTTKNEATKTDGTVAPTATNDSVKDSNSDTSVSKENNDKENTSVAVVTNETPKTEKEDSEDVVIVDAATAENKMREQVFNLGLEHLDTKLMYEMMSVPTCSDYEYRMVTYLILWARKHNIQHHFDDYGNLYFIKGKPKDNEFYPCVTAHLDTVQSKAKAYVLTGAELDLRTRKNSKNEYEVYIDGMGTGSDDKNAILIALHLFEKFDVLKGAFYLGEEVGCKGSSNMDEMFFNDVSYVIGFDSPEKNRAAWRLMGTVKMFTKDFYLAYMKDVCDKHGMTKFFSESITDEAHITKNTGLITMNFGNAGYLAHSSTEYFNVNELDDVIAMAIELVETIPVNKQHFVGEIVEKVNNITGKTERDIIVNNADNEFLESLGDKSKYNYYENYNVGNYYGGSYSHNNISSDTSTTSGSTSSVDIDEKYTEDTVRYIVDMYDQRIEDIKSDVESKCKELNIDFKQFAAIFNKEITF